MPKITMELGRPVAVRVAENVRRLRKDRGLDLAVLSGRLEELGQPISVSGLSKLELRQRRVDVDELVALAIALETNPNALLLDPEADDQPTELTVNYAVQRTAAWSWACGESSMGAGPWPWARFYPEAPEGKHPNSYRFETETRPHKPPRMLTTEEWSTLRRWSVVIDQIMFDMFEAGLPEWMFRELLKSVSAGTYHERPNVDTYREAAAGEGAE